MNRTMKSAVSLALAASGIALALPAQAGAIISNGTVQIGVRDLGNLNQPGGTPSAGDGTTVVGLRSVATNSDSTSPGCTCEGWGVAIQSLGRSGFANDSVGTANLQLVSFVSSASTATSVVNMLSAAGGNLLQVKHEYAPLANTPFLYQVTVSITNLTGQNLAAGDLLYRRVMDWDIPTPGLEAVTMQGVPAALGIANGNNVRGTSRDGFSSGDPLATRNRLLPPNACAPNNSNFTDCGPEDHGALFDFEFEALDAGATRVFQTFYGVAPTIAAADLARTMVDNDPDVDIGLYSYGVCTTGLPAGACNRTTGTPNTFIFGFGAAGGVLVPPDPTPGTVPVPGTLALAGLGLAALGTMRRRRPA